MASVSEELILLERVFLKIGTVDTDEELESSLSKVLPHVIGKLSNPSEEVRSKVVELLTHVNKRVKSRTCVQLPVETLLIQYQDPKASAFVINFAIIYIKLGFPRLPTEKRVQLLDSLVKAAEAKNVQHRESLIFILLGSLHLANIPHNDKSYLSIEQCPTVRKILLEIILNIFIYPYGWKKGDVEPAELSKLAYNQLTANLPQVNSSESLEQLKISCIKLLTCGAFEDNSIYHLLVIASADARSSVFNSAENIIRKISSGVELNKAVLSPLYSVYMGGGEGEKKKEHASTRLRLKMLPPMAKSQFLPFPLCVQVLFDSLYGTNTNTKLRSLALIYCENMVKHLPESYLSKVSELLLKSGLLQVIDSEWAEPHLIRQAFSCIGALVSRIPSLASQTLLQNLFNALIQERDVDISSSLRDCLVTMASAYSDQADTDWMQSIVTEALSCRSPKARSAALHYLTNSPDHSTNRIYLLLNAANHQDEEVSNEAKKALYGPNYKTGQLGEDQSFAQFDQLLTVILEKEATMPVNVRLHSEMLFYLRLCLAKAAGATLSLEQVEHPSENSPLISTYLAKINSAQPSIINNYVQFILKVINTDIGAIAVKSLIECLGCLPDVVRPLIETQIDKFMVHLGHVKEEVSEAVSQLIGLGVREDRLAGLCSELLETAASAGSDLERTRGALLAAGYTLQRAAALPDYKPPSSNLFNNLVNSISQQQNIIVGAGCQAIALASQSAPLPLSLQDKEALTDKLIDIIFQQKHSSKVKERGFYALGMLSIGEDFPHKEKIIKHFLEHSNEIKEVEMVLSAGEALVACILGDTGTYGLDPWTRQSKANSTKTSVERCNEMAGLIIQTLIGQVYQPHHPCIRQCCCFWLLAVTKNCSHLEVLKNKLQEIQNAFMELLSDSSGLVQEAAGRGLAIVYQSGGTVDKGQLLSRLVEQLTSGKRSVGIVSQDTKLFEEGQLGKAPTGGNLSTYKELCSLASDLNKPDLIYKFMSLANHNAVWNSKKGAAFGVSTLIDLAGSEMEEHLPRIIAKLYRYQYDPTPSIQQAMAGIWTAFTSNIPNVVDKYSREIYKDLQVNIISPQWRVRQSSCKALSDFMRSPASNRPMFQDCLEDLEELWTQLFRVMDDVHEATRDAATSTTKILARICMRECEKSSQKEKIARVILPVILQKGIKNNVSDVRAVSVSALSDLVKVGVAGNEVVTLVPALLVAAQELESTSLSHLSVMVSGSQAAQELVDSARASAIKSHFTVQTLTKCVDYIKVDMLPELNPQLVDLLKGTVGLGTRLATCHFITLLFHTLPLQEIQPYIGKYLAALLHGLNDRNSIIRRTYASTIGQLSRYAKDSSIDRLLSKLSSLYFEKEDEGIRIAIGYTVQAMLSHNQEAIKPKAPLILPLAYFAKQQIKQQDGSNEKAIEVWEEVSDDIGGNSGVILHSGAISELLINCLQSPVWANKAQAGRAITSLATKAADSLSDEVRTNLVNCLLSCLVGRTWDNKHYLLHALAALAKHNKNVEECERILEAVEKETRREKLSYKCEALRTLGDILATLKTDRFSFVYSLTKEVVNIESDEDEKDSVGKLVEVAYEALGKAWPDDVETQERLCVEVLTDCSNRLDKVPRQTQAAILSSIVSIIEKLHLLQTNPLPPVASTIVAICVRCLMYSLGITKHTNLRKTALNLLMLLISRTKGKSDAELNRLKEVYEAHKQELEVDTSSEVRSRLADIKQAFAPL